MITKFKLFENDFNPNDPYNEENWGNDETHIAQLIERAYGNRETPLNEIEFVMLDKNNIESLEGIGIVPNLDQLVIPYNNLKTLEGIEVLKKLKGLVVDNNQLISTKGIEELPLLEELYVFNNQLLVIEGLTACKKLRSLMCTNNHFDYDYIQDVTKYCKEFNIRLSI